ncbi:hypothetical protein ACHAWC_011342 [Mediolabrus comicus]
MKVKEDISVRQMKEDEIMYAQYQYMYNQRRALINESSVIDMHFSDSSYPPSHSGFIDHVFGKDIQEVKSWKDILSLNETARNSYLEDFANPDVTGRDLLCGRLCDTIQLFQKINGVRRHVLISQLNENWGAFSTPVPNRTVDWGKWEGHFKREGCKVEDLWWYLNHTNVSAVFTTTHQWLDHPKVFSLPLGIRDRSKSPGKRKIVEDLTTIQKNMTLADRTELLLIAQAKSESRNAIAEHVISNFNGTIKNKYRDGSDYLGNLRHAKFILSPSGMGWDCYRTWEALCMGTIPILERYYRKDGFYRVFDDLPVLWVDHYDNVTPSLLEASYPTILAKAEEYNFAKLTNQWWVDFINSFRDIPQQKPNMTMITKKNNMHGLFDSLKPVDVCDISELHHSFNISKMTLKQKSIIRAYIPETGSIAYAPHMTKCSSTSLTNALKHSTNNAPDISSRDLDDEVLDRYNFFSVIRHPLERALAGLHQVEVFWIMGWIDGPIREMNLAWWNKTCLNSTWGDANMRPCAGSRKETTTERRLQRLNDFLDEIEEKGYWDQHITPMTYLIATNKYSPRSTFYDIASVNNLTGIINQASGRENKAEKQTMKRRGGEDGQDWVFKWEELKSLMPHQDLAKAAVIKLCHLYKSDIECFGYDIPECASYHSQKEKISSPSTISSVTKVTAPEEKCSVPRPVRVAKNRAGQQKLTPGHSNCTLGWREKPSVNFGQNLEDAIIYHRFFSGGSPLAHLGKLNGVNGGTSIGVEGVERGIFLEMGALDGITFSNTLMFEQCLGWNGLLIEANPKSFTKLRENRPCAITVGEAACKVDDGPTLRLAGNEGVASIVKDDAKDNVVEVPCRPLSQMLEENGIDRINFFSLDVEGAELAVLQTLDWEKVKIDVLMVEADFVYNAQKDGTQDEKIKAVRDFVTSKGMMQVMSRLDRETDPSTGREKDVSLCQRNGYKDNNNCMFLSVAGSDVFVSPELHEYDTKPWLYEDGQ